MTMIIRAVVPKIKQLIEAEIRAGERAATSAIREETLRLKNELREQVVRAFPMRGQSLSRAWRSRIYPPTGQSLKPAGLVWSRTPAIIYAFERGAVIRPTRSGARYLTIPTGYNRKGGRRGGAVRVTPAQMVASGQAFVLPTRNGKGKVWCLPLRRVNPSGRGRGRLIAGGLVQVATGNRKGARAWQEALLARGFVPMFILLPAVKLTKRLDVYGAAQRANARLSITLGDHWKRAAP